MSKHGGQTFVEARCFSPHSSCGRENEWGERRVLYFTYSLVIGSLFLPLVLSIAGGRCLVLVGGGVGVEDPYIKVSLLESPTSHSVCRDIEPRPFL